MVSYAVSWRTLCVISSLEFKSVFVGNSKAFARTASFSCFESLAVASHPLQPGFLIRRLIRALPRALRFPSGFAVYPAASPLAVFLRS